MTDESVLADASVSFRFSDYLLIQGQIDTFCGNNKETLDRTRWDYMVIGLAPLQIGR